MSDFDRKRDRAIDAIRHSIKDLRKLKLSIEVDRDVETMVGQTVDHVYVVDSMIGQVISKKFLFTVIKKGI